MSKHTQIREDTRMKISLELLDYKFRYKPLLIGGGAMEYYGLRKAGADIDLVVSLFFTDGGTRL